MLEYLDYEYLAKGGLLGILPPEEDEEDRENAGGTLFGQFILQCLVEILHYLERLYANALVVIAGKTVAPHQFLSRLGQGGRKPRRMAYPQGSFVLINTSDDVYS